MSASAGIANRSIERVYQKKTQLEHILIRPDTYIGSVEKSTQEMWVLQEEEVEGEVKPRIIRKQITFVPGLYKIFDEILVNAADNKQRDKAMSTIKVDINVPDVSISIYNDGKGIPVTVHKKENVFVPTLIFGHLLTSSNFDDNERKVTGGRNGYGAKLCNVFSTEFVVETSCKEYNKSFRQVWRKNMSTPDEPEIEPARSKDFTRITFKPDLSRFNMETLDDDIVSLFKRRVYDMAASCQGVALYLNGRRLAVRTFEEYARLYLQDAVSELTGQPLSLIHQKFNERWEIAVTSSDCGFQQMSFVNSIATTKGGKHVDYITDQIVNKMLEIVKKKNKTGTEVKPHQLRSHLWVFINCLIENPSFDSQTKEYMTLAAKNFGSKCEITDDFVKKIRDRCGTVDSVLRWVEFKQKALLERKGGGSKTSKLKGIAKLDDANDAGTKNSISCTLIVTEGDSAKTLAVSGLGVIGRDRYGVFPLRGKLLNVREANSTQIMNNPEITNLCKILGLQYKEKYESPDRIRQLRYGKLMIMADQDQDGSHIKGLVINFIHHNWPNLIKYGFIEEFITPLVKVFKGNQELMFYSVPEFEEWQQQTSDWMRWRIKYYKGLGTSTSKEAKEYFGNMGRHRIGFNYAGPRDDLALKLAFSKTMIEERKDWLTRWMDERKRRRDENLPEDYLYQKNTKQVDYSSFVNKELILFSNLDNERSLPSMVDGLKPGQRKVLFTCFKRNLLKEIKVAQLAGSVAELSSYHHGEQSLMSTIVNLAHDFIGSNNINLLLPIGQFGTRIMGGKDAASARYIFTALNPLTRFIFSKQDDPILNYINDDGQYVEPEWYCPVIPMVLVNGAEGIGTGWSTKVPNFNPKEIITALRRMLDDQEPGELWPYYRGFRGTIQPVDQSRVMVSGELAILDDETIEITELPVGVWTQQYKDGVIEVLLTGSAAAAQEEATRKAARGRKRARNEEEPRRGGAVGPMISDYKEYNTDTTVRFVIKVTSEQMRRIKSEGFHKVFRLQRPLSLNNLVMFDAAGRLKRYETVQEVLREFFDVRILVYGERKKYRISQLTAESLRIDNMARFILEKIDGKIKLENVKKRIILGVLKERKYDPDPVAAWRRKMAQTRSSAADALQREAEEAESAEEEVEEAGSKDYDYLLGMPLWSLTEERKNDLLRQQKEKAEELSILRSKTERDMWREDLKLLEEEIIKQESKSFESARAGGKKAVAAKAKKTNPNTLPSEFGERVKPPLVTSSAGVEPDPGAVTANQPANAAQCSSYAVKRSKLVDVLMDTNVPDSVVIEHLKECAAGKKRTKQEKAEANSAGDDHEKARKRNRPAKKDEGAKQASSDDYFAEKGTDKDARSSPSPKRDPRPKRKAAEKVVYIGSSSSSSGMSVQGDDDSDVDMPRRPAKRAMAAAKISSESDFSLDVDEDNGSD